MTQHLLYVPLLMLCNIFTATSQQAAYFDAAQSYNRLIIEKNNGTYTRVSNYKVIGSPYLLGEKHKGNLFAPGETAYNISLSYNTYNQELEFYTTENLALPLIKIPGGVDSFMLHKNEGIGIMQPLLFINGKLVGAADKNFYQLLLKGNNFSLYKKYTAALGIVTTNYIQAELRQFNMNVDYYYTNTIEGILTMKLIKPTSKSITKEFNRYIHITRDINPDSLKTNPENTLLNLIETLNGIQ